MNQQQRIARIEEIIVKLTENPDQYDLRKELFQLLQRNIESVRINGKEILNSYLPMDYINIKVYKDIPEKEIINYVRS